MAGIVKIGEIEITATQVLNLNQSSQVPEHKTERQFSVADHVVNEPKVFSITIILFKDSEEYKALRKLYDDKEPVRFESELGDFDDMVIEQFNISKASLDTFRAVITIKQIRRAELVTRIVTFEDPATGADIETGEEVGGKTAVDPSENKAPDKPTKEEGENWVEAVLRWVGGRFSNA